MGSARVGRYDRLVMSTDHDASAATPNRAPARTRIKICGVRRPEDAVLAAKAGADAVGMILHAPGSKRLIEAEFAMAVADAIPPLVARVGVFVNARAPFVAQCARALRLDLLQLHGQESFDFVRALDRFRIVKVVRPEEFETWAQAPLPNLAALLLDSPNGGSGIENDWDAVAAAIAQTPPRVPVFVAGGLKPENVAAVVRKIRPWAVDVSSGVEDESNLKSADRVRAFVDAVREADARS